MGDYTGPPYHLVPMLMTFVVDGHVVIKTVIRVDMSESFYEAVKAGRVAIRNFAVVERET